MIELHRRNIDSTRNCDALNLNTDNRSEVSSLISSQLLKLFLNLSPFVTLKFFQPPNFSIASGERKIELPAKKRERTIKFNIGNLQQSDKKFTYISTCLSHSEIVSK